MGLISEAWTKYADYVVPQGAPRVQFIESRRAFYAGAQALLGAIMGVLEPGAEPTKKDLAAMDAIQDELEQFQRDMQSGVA